LLVLPSAAQSAAALVELADFVLMLAEAIWGQNSRFTEKTGPPNSLKRSESRSSRILPERSRLQKAT